MGTFGRLPVYMGKEGGKQTLRGGGAPPQVSEVARSHCSADASPTIQRIAHAPCVTRVCICIIINNNNNNNNNNLHTSSTGQSVSHKSKHHSNSI
jgi:hypothetical protein